MKNKNRLLPVIICITLMISGLSFTGISPLLTLLADELSVPLSNTGLLFSFNSVGFILLTLLGGAISERVGVGKMLAVSVSGLGICCLLLTICRTFASACAVMCLMGGCMGLIQSMGIAAGMAGLGARGNGFVHYAMMLYGVGALLGPVIVSVMLQLGLHWSLYFRTIGVVLLIDFAVLLAVRYGAKTKRAKSRQGQIHHLLRNKAFILCCLCMALYSGAEVGSWSWLSTYLTTTLHFTHIQSGIAVAIFWSGIILGRMVSGMLSKRVSTTKYLSALSIASAVICFVAFGIRVMWGAFVFIGFLGLVLAAVWPSIAMLSGKAAGDSASATYSVTIAASGLGSALIPYVQGILGGKTSMMYAMLVPCALLIMLAVLSQTAITWTKLRN